MSGALVVADMAEAVRFYRRLGLDFTPDCEDHAEADLGGGVRLMPDTEDSIRSFTPEPDPDGNGVDLYAPLRTD